MGSRLVLVHLQSLRVRGLFNEATLREANPFNIPGHPAGGDRPEAHYGNSQRDRTERHRSLGASVISWRRALPRSMAALGIVLVNA